jgi:hypothetical protein
VAEEGRVDGDVVGALLELESADSAVAVAVFDFAQEVMDLSWNSQCGSRSSRTSGKRTSVYFARIPESASR